MNTYELIGDLIEGIIKDFNWSGFESRQPLLDYALDHRLVVLDDDGASIMDFHCENGCVVMVVMWASGQNLEYSGSFNLRQPDALDALEKTITDELNRWKEEQCQT